RAACRHGGAYARGARNEQRVASFFLKLDDLVKESHQQWKSGQNLSSLVFVGHSFGAALLYSAVEDRLLERKEHWSSGQSRHDFIRGVGDLVVLVNPAFEAERYRPFDDLLRTRTFSPQQVPVLL